MSLQQREQPEVDLSQPSQGAEADDGLEECYYWEADGSPEVDLKTRVAHNAHWAGTKTLAGTVHGSNSAAFGGAPRGTHRHARHTRTHNRD